MVTNQKSKYVVFRDEEGRYYLLARQIWEQARVPNERQGDLEAIVTKGADVEGFVLPAKPMGSLERGIGTVVLIPSTEDMDGELEMLLA